MINMYDIAIVATSTKILFTNPL